MKLFSVPRYSLWYTSHQECSYQFVVFAPSGVRVTQPKSRELWLTVTFFHLGEFLFCFVSNFSILMMFHGAKEKTKLLLHVTVVTQQHWQFRIIWKGKLFDVGLHRCFHDFTVKLTESDKERKSLMMLKLLCSTWRHYSVFIFKCGTNKNNSQMLSALINLSEVRCSALNLDADYYWTVYVVCVGDDEEELSDGLHHSNVLWFCIFSKMSYLNSGKVWCGVL